MWISIVDMLITSVYNLLLTNTYLVNILIFKMLMESYVLDNIEMLVAVCLI